MKVKVSIRGEYKKVYAEGSLHITVFTQTIKITQVRPFTCLVSFFLLILLSSKHYIRHKDTWINTKRSNS